MSFMKFSKGNPIYSVPNGIGDGSAYFDGTTSAEITELEDLPIAHNSRTIFCSFYLEEDILNGEYQAIYSYGKIESSKRSGITICVGKHPVADTNALYAIYNNDTPQMIFGNSVKYYIEKRKKHSICFRLNYNQTYNISSTYFNLNDDTYGGDVIGVHEVSGKYFNTTSSEISIGKQNIVNSPKCVNFKGNIKNFQVFDGLISADLIPNLHAGEDVTKKTLKNRVLHVPLTYGKDDETLFKSKNFVYDTATYETSRGFNALGKPISYRSASQAGVGYSAYPVPKDALLSNCDSLTDNILNFINCEVSTDIKKFGKGSIKINSDGYIKFEHDLNLLNTAWTVGHFFYLENYASGDDWKPLINNDDDVVGTFLIGISSSGYLKWHVRANGSANITELTSGWHHLRVTHIESDKLRVYLDGVFITEFSGFSRANNTMWIGDFGYGSSYQFNGYIDSIECFEIPSDKLANYSGETAPVPSNKFSGV